MKRKSRRKARKIRLPSQPKRLTVATAALGAATPSKREQALISRAVAHLQKGAPAKAEELLRSEVEKASAPFDALHMFGVACFEQDRFDDAVPWLTRATDKNANSKEAHFNLGLALQRLARFDEAIESFERALALDDGYSVARSQSIQALIKAGRLDAALGQAERAAALEPKSAAAHSRLGGVLQQLKRYPQSIAHFEEAIRLNPKLAGARRGHAQVLLLLGRYEDALTTLGEMGDEARTDSNVLNNIAIAQRGLNKFEAALSTLQQARALSPNDPDVHANLGLVLRDLGRNEEAAEVNREGLKQDPDHVNLLHNLGSSLRHLGRFDEALASYRRALEVDPTFGKTLDMIAQLVRQNCDWQDNDQFATAVLDPESPAGRAVSPFTFLSYADDPAAQLARARRYVADRYDTIDGPRTVSLAKPDDAKIRLAYLSPDFRRHPVSRQIVELFELHDRDRFEVIGLSLGPKDGSDIRRRVEASFDRFIDVHQKSNLEIAELVGELGVHIAIDLAGHTTGNRLGAFALRPAPIQAQYLGYPGSLGADFIDYAIVDPFIVPAEQAPNYSEHLAYLPDCFQPNDSERQISDNIPSREEMGLPAGGFVFCSFNNTYKLTPSYFDVWMRLLTAVPGSVLWLVEKSTSAKGNLIREAKTRGVDPARLIFASTTRFEDYLARYRLADLFLDSSPYNAGTTASDALWAGLPIVTCSGRSFASRMAGSLLQAVGLPELITYTLEDYEALALALATSPERLDALRKKLMRNRETCPLFDSARFCRHIEAAYERMAADWREDKAPSTFSVAPIAETTTSSPTKRPKHRRQVSKTPAGNARLDLNNLQSPENLLRIAIELQKKDETSAKAEPILRSVLKSAPDNFDALLALGVVLHRKGDHAGAEAHFRRALAIKEDSDEAYANLSAALSDLGRHGEAAASARRAVELNPESSAAHLNLGSALRALGDFDAAIAAYRKAVKLAPDSALPHLHLGLALDQSGEYGKAAKCFRAALKIEPENLSALNNLGNCELRFGHLDKALDCYRRARSKNPDHTNAVSMCIQVAQQLCDWSDYERNISTIAERVAAGNAVNPFVYLGARDDLPGQLACSQQYFRSSNYVNLEPVARAVGTDGRYRVAYVSGDLHNHATAHLAAELFELHDRTRFEIIGLSHGPDDGSALRSRLTGAFDHFIDARGMTDAAGAQALADLGPHIAVDLKGWTTDSRMGILARRPAPIQAGYLGFPGTTGADFIDYIITDPFVTPSDRQPYYTERLVQLPDCYQVNDRKRPVAEQRPSRADVGLPEDGFVFCCFNNSYKFTPRFFDIWMRLLQAVPNSVLWLLCGNKWAEDNLKHEATHRRIDPARLIFAPRLAQDEHLARHHLADLFLDTLPCNAHTTASDALWAGLPVLTCVGDSLASRVAGSLLHAAGLPELVTENLEAYEALALELARDKARLGDLRRRLADNRDSCALFDSELFCRHLEAAYETMIETWQRGDKPEPFAVERLGLYRKPQRSRIRRITPPIQRTGKRSIPAVLLTSGRNDDVPIRSFKIALPKHPQLKDGQQPYAEGVLLLKRGETEAAIDCFRAAINANASHAGGYRRLAGALACLDRREECDDVVSDLITKFSSNVELLSSVALEFLTSGLGRQASKLLAAAREKAPDNFAICNNLGVALNNQDKFAEAEGVLRHALILDAASLDAQHNLGICLSGLRRYSGAIEALQKVLIEKPDDVEVLNSLGISLDQSGQHDEARAILERALAADSDNVDARHNFGRVLVSLRKYDDAIEQFNQLLERDENNLKALVALASAQFSKRDSAAALKTCQRALIISNDDVGLLCNLASVLVQCGELQKASDTYAQALELAPEAPNALSMAAYVARRACDWTRSSELEARLLDVVGNENSTQLPWIMLSLTDEPECHKRCAEDFCAFYSTIERPDIVRAQPSDQDERIRVAYLSPDFKRHPVARQVVEMFEVHDREKVEVIGISFGTDDDSDIRRRIEGACDQFFDVRERSDREIAELVSSLKVHIAVDLAGHTTDNRLNVFAYRPAPIQVQYIGHLGTMGAEFIDYVIVDPFVVPGDQQRFYTERLVHLPECFQINDRQRVIAEPPTRAELGLPEDGFVFCSFNNDYKLTPGMFDIWMRLLTSVPESVLWLIERSPVAKDNLIREARARGVDPSRLVFASTTKFEDYLARYRRADLFLDSLPYNAGTTASDALWAGLPVLTCTGRSFVSRMAGSLLRAVGLPELVTENLEAYESLALKLAREPETLRRFRAKLAQNRDTCPLFDSPRFCRHLEAAYATMYKRWQRGLEPKAFAVKAIGKR